MLLILQRWIGAPDFPSERAGTGLTSLKRKRGSKMLIIQCPPHELPRLVRSVGRLRGGCFWLECWTTPIIPPDPKYREPMPEDLVSQRCAWPQACRAMATASIHSPIAWAAD